MVTNAKPKFWMGVLPKRDDFRAVLNDEFIDGKTKMGPWGLMTPENWARYGVGQFGPGHGQRYVKQADGRFKKVEG